jgi:Leucyl aminopeptidase
LFYIFQIYKTSNSSHAKNNEFTINTETISNKLKNFTGYFLHGLNLKSYIFEKYKTKKSKNKISIVVTGKNIPSTKDQIKFDAIEKGTFYTRDLVSEQRNVLHPDEIC